MSEARGSEGNASDQRRHTRYEVVAFVDYTGTEVLLYHTIENISLGGICIQSTHVEPIGTIVELVISFPELDEVIATQGEIVWANPETPMDMGIRYIDLDDQQREILRRHLASARERRAAQRAPA